MSFSFLPADFFSIPADISFNPVAGVLYGTQRTYLEIKYRLNFGGGGLVRYVIISAKLCSFQHGQLALHVEIKLQFPESGLNYH
jgi:hypothetical protein